MSAVAYLRVSTEEQASEGVSLDAQRDRIEAYCRLRELDLVDVVVDAGVSAGKPLASREGGLQLLGLLRTRKVTAVVALKLDRLFRNAADCLVTVAGWDKANVSMHLVDMGGASVDTSSAMGRFFLTVMAGAAEMERNQIRERTSMAMKHMRRMGLYTGGKVPFGYRLDAGKLVDVDAEQAMIMKAKWMRKDGMSYRIIAALLVADGLADGDGKPVHPNKIRRMVLSA